MSARVIAAAQKSLAFKMVLQNTKPKSKKTQQSALNTFTQCMKDALKECETVPITPSAQQTKTWRKEQAWYKTGKSNECELYQRFLVENITQTKCSKTTARFNLTTFEFCKKPKPLCADDGFDWTEDFDGVQQIEDTIIYYNLKMVCDNGGAQTRALREVYHMVRCQLEHLLDTNANNVYFVNLLDGDQCHKRQKHFDYLLSNERYSEVKNKVFCGDMYTFCSWYKNLHSSLVSK